MGIFFAFWRASLGEETHGLSVKAKLQGVVRYRGKQAQLGQEAGTPSTQPGPATAPGCASVDRGLRDGPS